MECFHSRALLSGLLLAAAPCLPASPIYVQTNLASDISGLAAFTDANLKNPWGMSFSNTSPFWISNQGSDNSTLYNGLGAPVPLVVTVPPTGQVPGGPTGQVFNSTNTFAEANGTNASFIFDTLEGTIDAWNSKDGTTAEVMHRAAGATYTGLALNGSLLYAANFASGHIDVYDSSFAPATVSGSFTDPNLAADYSPYNIALVNGMLYVEYDLVNPTTHQPQPGAGLGVVDVFDTNGNFKQRLITGGSLNAPWGVTMAPAGFGGFGGDLLVGNFGGGDINAFDPVTGGFLGTLSDRSGKPIVNSGLWALGFRSGGPNVDTSALYFDAGINSQNDGLFGKIDVTPEPGTLALGLIGAGFLYLGALRRRKRA